jgi:hypothetical protein
MQAGVITLMYLVGVCVEPECKHTSQPLTAARVALRPRERLELPRLKWGIQVTLKQRR